KFMTTNAGLGIRGVIRREAVIEHILDLSDTKVFSAAVLPCILTLRRRDDESRGADDPDFQYAMLREGDRDPTLPIVPNVFDEVRSLAGAPFARRGINLASGQERVSYELRSVRSLPPEDDGEFWHFLSPDERQVIDRMLEETIPLSAVARKISCGI